ncbi:MAG: WYL domain-containing protein, partial [Bacteroides sp.]|nr:WYL domain-containing protein [Bacteroides sp.]
QDNLQIELEYENFFGVKFIGKVSPLCVKLFKRRWYVLCEVGKDRKRIFSLDRVKSLVATDSSFIYPKDFVPADYFRDVFGIVAGTGGKVENIRIRTYAELPGYLRSLPMHHSQQEIESNAEFTDFSLRLRPSFDFIQELLLHREQLEVLSPQTLRDEIAEIISKMKNHYN